MCGRFNMTADPLARLFMALVGEAFPGGDRLNVAPTETVPLIAAENGGARLAEMRWWLVPHWSKAADVKYATFNARSEKMATSTAFRSPFLRRRCVVPVSGFYEWVKDVTAVSCRVTWFLMTPKRTLAGRSVGSLAGRRSHAGKLCGGHDCSAPIAPVVTHPTAGDAF